MISTSILQSLISLNSQVIFKEEILLQSYKDMRNHAREYSRTYDAEKMQRLVSKTRNKIGKLARNQKYLKDQLNENTFNDYVDVMTYVFEG